MMAAGSRGAGAGAGAYRTRRFRALGHRFEVETSDHALGEYLDALFAALTVPGPAARDGDGVGHGEGVLRYTIVDHGPGHGEGDAMHGWELLAGGTQVVRAAEPPTVLAMLLWDVNRSVVERTGALLLLHAAAAELDGAAVVLPGAMEAGKTTLVAGLVRAGLRYLTDEVTAVDVAGDWIHPYPKALSVDPGSWPHLEDLEPAVSGGARRFLPDQWQVIPSAIRAGAVAPGARPRLVVLPRYEPRAATHLRPLSRADALVAVAGCAFRLEEDPAGTIGALARVLGGCASYELVYSDLDEGVRAVLGALDRTVHGPPGHAGDTGDAAGRPAARGRPREHASPGQPRTGGPMARTITPAEIGPQFAPRRHPGLTAVELDGEMVLYSGEGAMHKLDAIATVLWHCFDGSVTLAELVEDLDSVFEDAGAERITEDVLACVRELGRQGLLENVAPPDAGGDAGNAGTGGAGEAP